MENDCRHYGTGGCCVDSGANVTWQEMVVSCVEFW